MHAEKAESSIEPPTNQKETQIEPKPKTKPKPKKRQKGLCYRLKETSIEQILLSTPSVDEDKTQLLKMHRKRVLKYKTINFTSQTSFNALSEPQIMVVRNSELKYTSNDLESFKTGKEMLFNFSDVVQAKQHLFFLWEGMGVWMKQLDDEEPGCYPSLFCSGDFHKIKSVFGGRALLMLDGGNNLALVSLESYKTKFSVLYLKPLRKNRNLVVLDFLAFEPNFVISLNSDGSLSTYSIEFNHFLDLRLLSAQNQDFMKSETLGHFGLFEDKNYTHGSLAPASDFHFGSHSPKIVVMLAKSLGDEIGNKKSILVTELNKTKRNAANLLKLSSWSDIDENTSNLINTKITVLKSTINRIIMLECSHEESLNAKLNWVRCNLHDLELFGKKEWKNHQIHFFDFRQNRVSCLCQQIQGRKVLVSDSSGAVKILEFSDRGQIM